MKKMLFGGVALILLYALLREVAWRWDFMAALGAARQGRPPLVAGLALGFFVLRGLLFLAGPPLLAAAGTLFLWRRLTKS